MNDMGNRSSGLPDSKRSLGVASQARLCPSPWSASPRGRCDVAREGGVRTTEIGKRASVSLCHVQSRFTSTQLHVTDWKNPKVDFFGKH